VNARVSKKGPGGRPVQHKGLLADARKLGVHATHLRRVLTGERMSRIVLARFHRLKGAPLSQADTKLLAAYDLKHGVQPNPQLDMNTLRDTKPYERLIELTQEKIELLRASIVEDGLSLHDELHEQRRQLAVYQARLTELREHNARVKTQTTNS
jgi:hypothetical protein